MRFEKLLIFLSFIGLSCQNSIDPIVYGKNPCDNCKMTIMDVHFASAFMNKHGKTFKFDDITCLKKYIHINKLDESTLKIFVNQFKGTNELIDARKAVYVHDESFKSPMNGNLAAFIDSSSANDTKNATSVTMSWEEIK